MQLIDCFKRADTLLSKRTGVGFEPDSNKKLMAPSLDVLNAYKYHLSTKRCCSSERKVS